MKTIPSIIVVILLNFNVSHAQFKDLTWERTDFAFEKRSVNQFVKIDSTLYVITNDAIETFANNLKWEKVIDIANPIGLVKEGENFIVATLNGHVYKGKNLKELKLINSVKDAFFTRLLSINKRILICTSKGLYDINDDGIFKIILPQSKTHNEWVTNVVIFENSILVATCKELFINKSGDFESWQLIDFKNLYCFNEVLVDKNLLYFSTSGDGLYSLNQNLKTITKLNNNLNKRNIQKIVNVGNEVLSLYHKEVASENVTAQPINSIISDYIEHIDNFYLATNTQGIFKTPKLKGRNSEILDLNVFPNPSDSEVNFCIKNPSKGGKILIVNSLGQNILEKSINDDSEDTHCDKHKIELTGEYYIMYQTLYSQIVKSFKIIK